MTDSPATGALHPALARLEAQYRDNLASFEALCDGLSDAQFNWRSEPGRWSIAQNLAHLNVVNGLDLEPLAAAIHNGRARNLTAPGPYKYPWLNRYFIRQLEPPVKSKLKAPKAYLPPPERPLQETFEEYRHKSLALCDLLHDANGLDLACLKTPSPLCVS